MNLKASQLKCLIASNLIGYSDHHSNHEILDARVNGWSKGCEILNLKHSVFSKCKQIFRYLKNLKQKRKEKEKKK